MRGWRLMTLCSVLLGSILGCEQPKPVASDPTTMPDAPPASKPATEPSFEEKMAALSPYASKTTRPAATTTFVDEFATTKPLPPDPLATPDGAIRQFLSALRDQNPRAVREVCLDDPYEPSLQPQTQKLAELARSGVVSLTDQHVDQNVAISILSIQGKKTGRHAYFALAMLKRFDQWRVQVGDVNPRRLSPEERSRLEGLTDWSAKRIHELSSGSSAPSTLPTGSPPTSQRSP